MKVGAAFSLALFVGTACSIRPYVTTRVGLSDKQDAKHEPGITSSTFPNALLGAAAGLQFGAGWRAEVEFSYREYTFGDFDLNGSIVGGHGEAYTYGLLANCIYEFPVESRFHPYVGIGAGAARSGYEVDSFGGPFLDDDDDVFAAQLLLGVTTRLSEHWHASLGYRLMRTEDPVLVDALNRRFDTDHTEHSLDLAFTYTF